VENRDERMAISCERFSIEMLITKSSVPELLFAFSGDGGDPAANLLQPGLFGFHGSGL
jgi:hypothetical protein